MNSIWKRAAVALLAGVLMASVAGCSSAGSDTDGGSTGAEPIKIGAILSLTGTYAALGASEKSALELEVKALNDDGGIDGRPVEIIFEDDATDEAKAVAAASKLIEQDGVVAILGATGTGQSMAIRGDIDRAGVVQISMAGGTAITAKLDPLVFQTPWSNTIVVPFVLDAIKSAGISKIALLSDTGGYGKDGKAVIEADAPKAGIDIVANETFNPGDTDVTAQLTKIKDSDAQAVLLWTAGKEAVLAVKSARDLGIELPFYGGSGQARKEFVEGAGPAADGFVFGTGKSLVPANWGANTAEYEVVNGFATRYQAAYGEQPDIFAGHAFDAFAIVTDALTRAGADADAAAVAEAVQATKGLIGYGGTFSFTESNHNGLTAEDLALYRVTGGTWEPMP